VTCSPGQSPSCGPVGLARRPDRARLRPLSLLGLRPQTIRGLQTSALNFGHPPSATRRPPPEEAHPQDHGLRPCPGWPTALRSSAFVQATTVRSAAPQTFAVELGIVPQAAGAQVRRLRASSLPGPASDHRLHRATIRDSLAPPSALLAPPLVSRGQHRAPHR